jgi:hypothetical protein
MFSQNAFGSCFGEPRQIMTEAIAQLKQGDKSGIGDSLLAPSLLTEW